MRRRLTSRRQFLVSSGALGAAAMFGGCALPSAGERPLTPTGELRVINWSEYIDPATVDRIRAELGIAIEYRDLDANGEPVYPDNVTGLTTIIEPQLSGGGTPDFDLIVPTNWLAGRMIANGWAEALPLEAIPNHVNVDPAYLTNDWDRGSRFQMPWQGGITGISYDPDLVGGEIASIADLFDESLEGRAGLVGEMREAVGFAMLLNGDDPSRPTPSTARAGLEAIRAAAERGHFAAVVFDDFVGRLQDGSVAATMAWSGQAAALALDDPRFRYVIPEEGGISWFDSMVIPRNAANYENAARWMNWAYDPANAAEIAAWNLYVCPVLGTREWLRSNGQDELADNPLVFPDAETRNNLFTWGSLDLATEQAIEAEFDDLVFGGTLFDPDTLDFIG